jgi:hypothetical protein
MSPSDLLKASASVGMAGTNMLELHEINTELPARPRTFRTHDIVVQIAERPARTTILHLVLCENAEYGTWFTCAGTATIPGSTFASAMTRSRSSERPWPWLSNLESPAATRTDGADTASVVDEES